MEWLSSFFEAIFVWIPRVVIVRSTHGGVKWATSLRGEDTQIVELKPGLHWYWPFTSEIDLIVTARRTVDVPTMSLLTKDGISVIVSAAVVIRINRVVQAIGEKNWDVDSTLVDITNSVIYQQVRSQRFEELCQNSDGLLETLTALCKDELRRFGILVERVLIKDFDRSRTYRMLGETTNFLDSEPEE
jgi:regulator of protease activity HflC (stomatin/prohibitin superfamily)